MEKLGGTWHKCKKNRILKIRCCDYTLQQFYKFVKDNNFRTLEDALIYFLKKEKYWERLEFA